MTFLRVFAVWFAFGLVLSLPVPFQNFDVRSAASWKALLIGWPFFGMRGPFAYFMVKPVPSDMP